MFDDRSPIYRQIAEQIRTQILDGTLADDEQVMSTTQYANFYRINPATAAKAFAELVDEDTLYKRRGVGMFVAPGARDRLRQVRRRSFFAQVVDPMVSQARALDLPLADIRAYLDELETAGDTDRQDEAPAEPTGDDK